MFDKLYIQVVLLTINIFYYVTIFTIGIIDFQFLYKQLNSNAGI